MSCTTRYRARVNHHEVSCASTSRCCWRPHTKEQSLAAAAAAAAAANLLPAAIATQRKQRTQLTEQERAQLIGLTRECTKPCKLPRSDLVDSRVPLAKVRLKLNMQYTGLKQIHVEPPVFLVEDFLSDAECAALIMHAAPQLALSRTANNKTVDSVRTSSSCMLPHSAAASSAVLTKVEELTQKDRRCMEAVQVARYTRGQQYREHYDAPNPHDPGGFEFLSCGGQRLCTVLVYLVDVPPPGGKTSFPLLPLSVEPKRGSALIFFPGMLDGRIDPKLLHCAEPASATTKWVAQVWIRALEDPLWCLPNDARPVGLTWD